MPSKQNHSSATTTSNLATNFYEDIDSDEGFILIYPKKKRFLTIFCDIDKDLRTVLATEFTNVDGMANKNETVNHFPMKHSLKRRYMCVNWG